MLFKGMKIMPRRRPWTKPTHTNSRAPMLSVQPVINHNVAAATLSPPPTSQRGSAPRPISRPATAIAMTMPTPRGTSNSPVSSTG